MGYRSEVAISVLEKDFNKFVKGLDIEEDKDVLDLLKYGNIRKSGKVITLYWDDVKWYEEYSDVNKIMNWLDKLADNDSPAKFVRIGEDQEDIEVKEYCNNYNNDEAWTVIDSIYPVKYISVPEDYEKINIKDI